MRVNTVVDYITDMSVNSEITIRKLVSLPRDLVAQVEDFRFEQRIKAESEAIRVLLRAGLEALKPTPRKQPRKAESET